ncbi:MAG TPA: HAMP domain-containing sensor histidine kinase [Clostridia bacterium]|nr:HAMP domain-containing sensor histidine kinase [Clostridia bacterium]
MDTNLKDDIAKMKNKAKVSFTSTTAGTLLMILILAVVSVGIYAPIKDYAFDYDIKDYLESRNFVHLLANLTDDLYQAGFRKDYSYNTSLDNLKNIKYYMKSESKDLVSSNVSEISLGRQINNSQFYLRVKIDAQGNPTVVNAPDWFNKNLFISFMNNTRDKYREEFTDLDIIYTVPKTLSSYDDILTHYAKSANIQEYILLIFIIGGISILLLTILAFAIPFASQKKAGIIRAFNSIYLEFKFLICSCFFLTGCFIPGSLARVDEYYNGLQYTDIIYNANWYFYVIGIPVTFLLYTFIYLSIVNIKYIYHKGFKDSVVKNTLLYYIFRSVKIFADDTVNYIIDSDITKEHRRKLIVLLVLNLLAIYIIKITWPLGVFFAIAYTVFLLDYSTKALVKVRALNDASSLLAKGDFNMVLPEDMGMLSPFARNLNNIKHVFMTAVREEIKSQNMKTQLITNVSHDLKTPLTSIITYVDLLKNGEIDEETRQEYIDILDVKSKRLKVLIDDLFEVSKTTSGDVELDLEAVDVIALLRQTLGELEEKINESTLQMKISLPENKIVCELDGRRTYRVFENIISNILKYAMPNTRVYIDAKEVEGQVSFVFKNISAYEMNFDPSEIMERFTQGDTSRTAEGSGLGLAIAKSLVELQGGSLYINIDGDLFKLTVAFPKKAA